ncbi:MAG: response regulator [Deltaproteobacteria bacterium]|nr:response regulator [Deltaproteobacteria bacterium]
MSSDKKKPIGSILLKQRAVSAKQLEKALKEGKRGDPPLVSRLTDQGVIAEPQALKALSEQSGCPGIDLNQVVIRLDDLRLVPREMAERHSLIPVLVKGNRMFVAMADPGDKAVVDELELVTGKRAFPYIALKANLRRVVSEAYDGRDRGLKHYVGPKCPPETMRKAGVAQAQQEGAITIDEAPSTQLEKRLRPSNPRMQAVASVETPVFVDDAIAAASSRSGGVEFDEPTFGAVDTARGAPPQQRPMQRPAPHQGKTLLVVDADREVCGMVTSVFSERGYRVLEADRGDAALQLIRSDKPHAMILEATLPSVHGFEVARQLKGSEHYRDIFIIMVSGLYRGWRFAEDLKANYGIDAFLEKPLRIDDLVHTVDRAGTGTPDAQPTTSAEAEPYLRAGIEAYKAGRLDDAIGQLRGGIQRDPLAFECHFHLGLLFGKAGQLYDAIQELETALSIRSDFFPALKNLAVLYQNAGFRNKAIEMWSRCLTTAPDDKTRESIKRLLVAVL